MSDINVTVLETDIWLIDDRTRELFVIVTCCIVNATVAFIGIVGNVLNIAVFCKLGFRETTNISLLGLSISDLGCLLTVEWIYLCFNPLFNEAGLPFVPFEVEYITGGWPHVCFARITGFITVYVTLERCLCIALPLTVRRILTPARTSFVIAGIFLTMFASVSPAFTVNLLQWKFYPLENRTKVGIVYTEHRAEVERVLFATNNSFGYVAFALVSIFTAVLVSDLKRKSKWRQESVGSSQTASALSRDGKVIKMVVTVSSVFILMFFPITIVFMGTMAFPQFGTGGRYANLFYVCATCAYTLEIINSSSNFVIFMTMSGKFKQTAYCLLPSWFKRANLNKTNIPE